MNVLVTGDNTGKKDDPEKYLMFTGVSMSEILRDEIYVVRKTPGYARPYLPVGSVTMTDTRRTERWHKAANLKNPTGQDQDIRFHNVWKDGVFSAHRATVHMARRAMTDLRNLQAARLLVEHFFMKLFAANMADAAAVAEFKTDLLRYAALPIFVTKDEQGLKAELHAIIEYASDLTDILGRPNKERVPLMLDKVARLEERLYQLLQRWQTTSGLRETAMDTLVQNMLGEAAGKRRVALQALSSKPMQDPSVGENKEVATLTWPRWAAELDSYSLLRPLGCYFKEAAEHLRKAAAHIALPSEVEIAHFMEELRTMEALLRMPQLFADMNSVIMAVVEAEEGVPFNLADRQLSVSTLRKVHGQIRDIKRFFPGATDQEDFDRAMRFTVEAADQLNLATLTNVVSPEVLELIHDNLSVAMRELSLG